VLTGPKCDEKRRTEICLEGGQGSSRTVAPLGTGTGIPIKDKLFISKWTSDVLKHIKKIKIVVYKL
jgi:hypothetical protein